MRFLVDNALSPKVADHLRASGHDCVHVRDIGLKNASDQEIFDIAIADQRHVLTADTDFASIAVRSGLSVPSVLLVRLQPSSVADDILYIDKAIQAFEPDIEAGCVVSILRSGMRVRKLPFTGKT